MEVGGETEVAMTTARRTPIWSASLQHEFLPPAIFDHLDVKDWAQRAMRESDTSTTRAGFRVDAVGVGEIFLDAAVLS